MNNRILFIVPHADDEVLGFGGTIAKFVDAGKEVIVTIAQAPNNDRADNNCRIVKMQRKCLDIPCNIFCIFQIKPYAMICMN